MLGVEAALGGLLRCIMANGEKVQVCQDRMEE
jgi:hypothetical protein